MTTSDDLKGAISATAELIKAAGDSPEAKQAASNIGKTAIVVTETINNLLLPIAAVNYGIKRAGEYFQQRFAKDLQEETKSIPPEELRQPKSSFAGPAVQALSFCVDEDELRTLYVKLLASAMDGRQNAPHPSFVEVLRQLSAAEAGLISNPNFWFQQPLARLSVKRDDAGTASFMVANHLCPIEFNGIELRADHVATLVDNLSRLGLFEYMYDSYFADERNYEWIQTSQTFRNLSAEWGSKLRIEKGILRSTAFGRSFATALKIELPRGTVPRFED